MASQKQSRTVPCDNNSPIKSVPYAACHGIKNKSSVETAPHVAPYDVKDNGSADAAYNNCSASSTLHCNADDLTLLFSIDATPPRLSWSTKLTAHLHTSATSWPAKLLACPYAGIGGKVQKTAGLIHKEGEEPSPEEISDEEAPPHTDKATRWDQRTRINKTSGRGIARTTTCITSRAGEQIIWAEQDKLKTEGRDTIVRQ